VKVVPQVLDNLARHPLSSQVNSRVFLTTHQVRSIKQKNSPQ
jgi:hypothetical protein